MSLDQSFILKPTRNQLIGLLVILGLILILSWALTLVQQRQEWRRRAWGTGEVLFSIAPGSGEYQAGDDFSADVVMTNQNETADKTIRVSGLELEFDESVFEINSVACNETIFPPFYHPDSGEKLEIPGFGYDVNHPGEIHLTCYRSPEDGDVTVTIPASGGVNLGTIVGKVKTSAPEGETQIIASRAVIPEDKEEPVDIANPEPPAGQPLVLGAYIISGGVVVTPTPSPTPTTEVTPTPTPTGQPGKGHLSASLKLEGVYDERPVRGVDVVFKEGTNVHSFENQGLVYVGNGVYSVTVSNIEPGTYDPVLVKGWIHLQKNFTDDFGPVEIVADQPAEVDWTGFALLTGDAENNNEVDIYDYNVLATDFNGRDVPVGDSNADFDRDGDVDIYDYNLLAGNFAKTGDE